jgi:sec-independent protein translocase protein TatB
MALALGSPPVFDFDLKLLVLAVIALIVFGPERLPAFAAQVGRALRELRRMAEGAKSELQENLGPEFSQFDITDINPKRFVRKHLLDDLDDPMGFGTLADANGSNGTNGTNGTTLTGRTAPVVALSPGERPPYDAEAT